jgi:hypothetical protein
VKRSSGTKPTTPITGRRVRRRPAKRIRLAEDEARIVQAAALAVWQHVGYDVIATVADSKGKSPETLTIPRDKVLEIIVDAGRLEDQLRADIKAIRFQQKRIATIDFDALVKKVEALTPDEITALLTPAFSLKRYGL